MPDKKFVTIQLDKERHLLINLNSMCAFEEQTGKKFLDVTDSLSKGEWPSVTDFRALFWAALIHEDKNLSVEQVGELIAPSDMNKLAEAISASMPSGKGDESPLEEKHPQD